MHGSTSNVPPWRRRPRMLSSPARYIQPAEPVYQVHPARPACSGWARDVAGEHVRLAPVALDVGPGARVVHRVQHVEELGRLVAAPEPGERHHHPRGRVRVLAAVLAHAGRVALDVPGVLRGAIERRREQHDHLRPAPHEVGADRVHRAVREARRRRAGEHRPRLGDRVDLALVALRRAERRAVVVVAAPVPLAVPGFARARTRGGPPRRGSDRPGRRLRARAQRREVGEDRVEEEAEPGALAAPLPARRGSSRRSSRRSP